MTRDRMARGLPPTGQLAPGSNVCMRMSAVGEFSHSMCILFGVLFGLGPVQAWNTKELHKFGNTVRQWTAGKLQDCGRLLAAGGRTGANGAV